MRVSAEVEVVAGTSLSVARHLEGLGMGKSIAEHYCLAKKIKMRCRRRPEKRRSCC